MFWEDFPLWANELIVQILEDLREKYPATYAHCCRVGKASGALAKAAGLSKEEQIKLQYAGLFHDVGKYEVPDSVLNKPGKLDDKEYSLMKRHPEISADLIEPLAKLHFFEKILPGVLHHHERIDGLGYPFGLEGDKIPIEARIILIVDTFDAMTSDRAYRKGLPDEVAFKEIKKCSGSQFDTHLAKIFLQSKNFDLGEEDLEWKKVNEAGLIKVA